MRANRERRLAIALEIEGLKALNDDINLVGLYHARGLRQSLFAYNLNNEPSVGCHDTYIGLTDFGCAIVREMNLVGIIVDSSHSSYLTSMDIIAASAMPVVFSHSNSIVICHRQGKLREE